ncbi:hypothetical protein NPIL_673821 [Nephila pilipes]|uniref:Uncharacterized protein n=1 Tax=Nephila pilipes TaxID=299642 RepID=A0A8X6MYB7_NEPPI|nr:hypothetical protein NPIL_673821 [Nephila pilipes]
MDAVLYTRCSGKEVFSHLRYLFYSSPPKRDCPGHKSGKPLGSVRQHPITDSCFLEMTTSNVNGEQKTTTSSFVHSCSHLTSVVKYTSTNKLRHHEIYDSVRDCSGPVGYLPRLCHHHQVLQECSRGERMHKTY